MTKGELSLYEKRGASALIAEADRQLAARRQRSRRLSPRKAAGRVEKQSNAEREAAISASLRRQALARCGGYGELCGEPLDEETAQLCHLDGGSGKKRQRQWIGNVLMEHPECHQGKNGLDRNPLGWLTNVKRWAARNFYPVPERFRKLEELRAPLPASRRDASPTTTPGDDR